LAAALEGQAGEGRLYRRAAVRVLADEAATLPAIREALAWFTRDVAPDETLILFLSGHGVREGERFYFAPVALDPADMPRTGLPWKEVLACLEATRQNVRAVWVLADCCRAAPGLGRERQATGQDLRREAEERGNLLICTASSGDAPSYESEELRHGLFTRAWLEVLRGEWLQRLDAETRDLLCPETPRGRVLTLAGLQFLLDASVSRLARDAGVLQQIEFPRLQGRLSPGEPVFLPRNDAGKAGP
jgi:uncharacterized caspase-like protein